MNSPPTNSVTYITGNSICSPGGLLRLGKRSLCMFFVWILYANEVPEQLQSGMYYTGPNTGKGLTGLYYLEQGKA
jgi:hypothetical protein